MSQISTVSQSDNTTQSLDDVLDLKIFTTRYPQFTIPQLRWLINQRKINGLADHPGTLFKIGKRWYLNVTNFLEWIQSENNHSYGIKSNQHPAKEI